MSLELDPGFHACSHGRRLTITADCDPDTHPYIAGISVNGTEIDRAYLTWDELTGGGEIVYRLSDKPTDFGRSCF